MTQIRVVDAERTIHEFVLLRPASLQLPLTVGQTVYVGYRCADATRVGPPHPVYTEATLLDDQHRLIVGWFRYAGSVDSAGGWSATEVGYDPSRNDNDIDAVTAIDATLGGSRIRVPLGQWRRLESPIGNYLIHSMRRVRCPSAIRSDMCYPGGTSVIRVP